MIGAQLRELRFKRDLSLRALAAEAGVSATLLSQVERPAILHWLGAPFDPALEGYWGSADLDEAAEHVLGLIREHAARIDGIKVSLLDAKREIALRRLLPDGVKLYTGDDFDYPDLIRGDETRAPVGAHYRARGMLTGVGRGGLVFVDTRA